MKTIGIFYGSSTGTTEGIAKRIAEKLGVEDKDIHDVSNASPADVAPYEILLLCCSTWGAGDLQDDWDSYLGKLKKLDLSEKTVALFGCGDSASFSDTFCDAIGTIYSDLRNTGCKFIGAVDASGIFIWMFHRLHKRYVRGLPLDEMNEDDQTEGRIDQWLESIRKEGIE